MIKSLFDVVGDVVKTTGAVAEVPLTAVRLITKPVADIAEEFSEGLKEATKREE